MPDKPGSVPTNVGGNHPSRPAVAWGLKQPTRALHRTDYWRALFGLAPGGVYRATAVTCGTGELLPHLFTLTPVWGGLFSVALACKLP